MSASAHKLDRPHSAWGVGLESLPRHLTITQAEGLIQDLRLAIKAARQRNNDERAEA